MKDYIDKLNTELDKTNLNFYDYEREAIIEVLSQAIQEQQEKHEKAKIDAVKDAILDIARVSVKTKYLTYKETLTLVNCKITDLIKQLS